jgi:hypothetical protein
MQNLSILYLSIYLSICTHGGGKDAAKLVLQPLKRRARADAASSPLVYMRSLARLLTRPEVRQTRRLLAVQHRWATGGSSSQHSRIGREVTALDVLKNSRQGAVQFVHESESVRLRRGSHTPPRRHVDRPPSPCGVAGDGRDPDDGRQRGGQPGGAGELLSLTLTSDPSPSPSLSPDLNPTPGH